MDFRQLEMFLAIVDEGGFTKAAAKLFVAQSAISRKVRLLEDELHEPLFLRVGNRVLLTHAGRALAAHSRAIFERLQRAADEISGAVETHQVGLTLGTGVTACIYMLPPLLRRFRERFPRVELKIVTGADAVLAQEISNGRIDLGWLALPIYNRHLSTIRLVDEEMVIVVSVDHPWSQRGTIKAQELVEFPLIMIRRDSAAGHTLYAMFKRLGVTPHITMEHSTFATIRPLVEINLGISIMPLMMFAREPRNPRVHILHFEEEHPELEFGLVHAKTPQLPKLVEEMIRLFEENLSAPARAAGKKQRLRA
jgi:DNA-binding transcriptional LysR family regulator